MSSIAGNFMMSIVMHPIALAMIDLLSLGLLFWLIPQTLIRLLRGQLAGIDFKPAQEAMKHLPGAITGTAAAAFAVYLFGMSYEDFAISRAKEVGNWSMQLRVSAIHCPHLPGKEVQGSRRLPEARQARRNEGRSAYWRGLPSASAPAFQNARELPRISCSG
ncbi:hypothetical protein [Paracoccus sp. SSK6]|uniref:hypothetical protein n=1 Tax=Paracoccus sp. SSK6 TaxID=3143131 RepID=UPI00321B8CB0